MAATRPSIMSDGGHQVGARPGVGKGHFGQDFEGRVVVDLLPPEKAAVPGDWCTRRGRRRL